MVIIMFDRKTIRDIDIRGKKVIVRVDYNVPLGENLSVTDDTRIRLSIPTIKYLIENNARIILISHLGRPKGKPEDRFRLDPAALKLEELTGVKVKKFDSIYSDEIKDYIDNRLQEGGIVMLENLRFDPGEKSNDREFSMSLASLGDIYVNDAFGAAHRSHASVVGIPEFLPAVSGLLLEKEVETLTSLLESPERPFLAILGGSKVSDKIKVIRNLLSKVEMLILGGGMTYTFLKSKGMEIGKSICEDDQLDYAEEMISLARKNNVSLILPVDIIAAREFDRNSKTREVPVDGIPSGWMGLDIGSRTVDLFKKNIAEAGTIFWNGPVGVFEWEKFSKGTKNIAFAIAGSNAVTVAGGGDTIAAIKRYGLAEKFSHISSGGGASMELLEGRILPGVEALIKK
jgi:3-phosphoglycerate kinase